MLSTGILICCTGPFVYLASVCWSLHCLISALTQAGGSGLLFRFASSVALWGAGALLSLSTLLRLPAALYGACSALRAVPVFGYSTKAQTRLRLRFVPSPALAAQAARSLTGALSPGVVRLLPFMTPASVSASAGQVRAPCVSPPPSRRMSTIQNLRKSLVRNWRSVCSVVGDATSGAEFCPFPLPPASCLRLGRSVACELFSGLARSLCSANGRQCVQAG